MCSIFTRRLLWVVLAAAGAFLPVPGSMGEAVYPAMSSSDSDGHPALNHNATAIVCGEGNGADNSWLPSLVATSDDLVQHSPPSTKPASSPVAVPLPPAWATGPLGFLLIWLGSVWRRGTIRMSH